MMINGTVTGDREVVRKLKEIPGSVRTYLTDAISTISVDLQNYVRYNKLSGQVLNPRSTKLLRSIEQRVVSQNNAVTGIVWSTLGVPSYASFWEFGYHGTEDIRQHLRTITMAFGRKLKTPVTSVVKQHKRSVNQDARSFLRSALDDKRSEFIARIDKAVAKGLAQS